MPKIPACLPSGWSPPSHSCHAWWFLGLLSSSGSQGMSPPFRDLRGLAFIRASLRAGLLQGSWCTLRAGNSLLAGFLPPSPARCGLQQHLTLACAQLLPPPFLVFWARDVFCSQSTSSGRSASRLHLCGSFFFRQYAIRRHELETNRF